MLLQFFLKPLECLLNNIIIDNLLNRNPIIDLTLLGVHKNKEQDHIFSLPNIYNLFNL